MKTTLNEALELVRQGRCEEAWEVAQQDEGMLDHVTFESWLPFAFECLKRRGVPVDWLSTELR